MRKTDIVYEPGKAEDAAAIYELYRRAIAHLIAQGIDQWDEEYPNQGTIEEDVRLGQLTVGKLDGRFILAYVLNHDFLDGFENGAWQGDEAASIVMHRFVVDPEYQNKGIAVFTIEHMAEELRKQGINSIRIDTFPPNEGSIRMYTRAGFRKVGEFRWRKGVYGIMEKIF